MTDRIELTDDLLRRALAKRMAHAPDPRLLERVLAVAADVTQEQPSSWRRLPGGGSPDPVGGRRWAPVPAFAGLAAAVAIALAAVIVLRAPVTGPGATPSPSVTPAPEASATPSLTPSAGPGATPLARVLEEHQALRLHMANPFELVNPIGLAFADGSIWTANITANDVRRFDPDTMDLLARVPMTPPAGGPGWFAASPGAVWVSNQLGNGLTRIDTATNTVVGTYGLGGTCGAPVLAFESVWQSICDSDAFLRINPSTNELQTIPAEGHDFLVLAGDALITSSVDGLASLDPETLALDPLPYSIPNLRQLLGADAQALWGLVDTGVVRVDAATGDTLASFPYTDAQAVAFGDGRAWLTVGFVGAVEIDLATNQELQTIPVEGSRLIPLEASGVLWVTDFDNSNLWRIEP